MQIARTRAGASRGLSILSLVSRITVFNSYALIAQAFSEASGRRQPELGATNLGLDSIGAFFFLRGHNLQCEAGKHFCAARHFARKRTEVKFYRA